MAPVNLNLRKEHVPGVHPKRPATRYSYKLKLPGLIRLLAAVLIFAFDLFIFIRLALYLNNTSFIIYVAVQALAIVLVLFLTQQRRNIGFTLSWTIALLAFPPLGILLYAFWGRKGRFTSREARLSASAKRLAPWHPDPKEQLERLDKEALSTGASLQLHYLAESGFSLYRNTSAEYFHNGESQFEQMFHDLENAEHYIFLEYFILAEGYLLERLEGILIKKAAQGLDVRLLFDDYGSTAKAPSNLMRHLQKHGVKVINFNPVLRYIAQLYVNHRNHQKVCVIDGKIAWLGGANLADEYANIYERFGYWKDTSVRLMGEAARGAAIGFLLMWEMESTKLDEDYSRFFPELSPEQIAQNKDRGVFVPYWDGPLGNQGNPAVDLYLSLINTSKRRLYIVTPYFIIDENMMLDLCRAARSGVEVILLTPGIPDKKVVFLVTRSNYGPILESGGRVFEYTPGFIHSKTMISDGERAVCGSINLDYRSLYLHFENAVYIQDDPVIGDMEQDFLRTLENATEITYEDWRKRPLLHRLFEPLVKIFSPLL